MNLVHPASTHAEGVLAIIDTSSDEHSEAHGSFSALLGASAKEIANKTSAKGDGTATTKEVPSGETSTTKGAPSPLSGELTELADSLHAGTSAGTAGVDATNGEASSTAHSRSHAKGTTTSGDTSNTKGVSKVTPVPSAAELALAGSELTTAVTAQSTDVPPVEATTHHSSAKDTDRAGSPSANASSSAKASNGDQLMAAYSTQAKSDALDATSPTTGTPSPRHGASPVAAAGTSSQSSNATGTTGASNSSGTNASAFANVLSSVKSVVGASGGTSGSPNDSPAQQLPGVASQLLTVLTPIRQTTSGSQTMTIALHPEGLGDVKATMTLSDGSLVVRLTASTPEAAEALRSALPDLQSGFLSSGATPTLILGDSGSSFAGSSPNQGQSEGTPEPFASYSPTFSSDTAPQALTATTGSNDSSALLDVRV